MQHAQDSALTYAELDEQSGQLACYLAARGVGPEVPVGVMLERGLDLMVALLAVLKAGGAFVPMDPEYPEDRLAIMAEDAAVPVLLSQAHIRKRVPLPPSSQRIDLDVAWPEVARQASGALAQTSGPDSLAYVIFTSGSTGRPKGTLLRHAGLINYLHYLARFALHHYLYTSRYPCSRKACDISHPVPLQHARPNGARHLPAKDAHQLRRIGEGVVPALCCRGIPRLCRTRRPPGHCLPCGPHRAPQHFLLLLCALPIGGLPAGMFVYGLLVPLGIISHQA